MGDLWMNFLPVALFFAWLVFFSNSRAPDCPDCGSPLPVFQSPFTKTRRQWAGGATSVSTAVVRPTGPA